MMNTPSNLNPADPALPPDPQQLLPDAVQLLVDTDNALLALTELLDAAGERHMPAHQLSTLLAPLQQQVRRVLIGLDTQR